VFVHHDPQLQYYVLQMPPKMTVHYVFPFSDTRNKFQFGVSTRALSSIVVLLQRKPIR
jgi:hypothetical protein